MGGRKELGQGLLLPVQNLLRARLPISCFPVSATSTNSFLLGRAQGELCSIKVLNKETVEGSSGSPRGSRVGIVLCDLGRVP